MRDLYQVLLHCKGFIDNEEDMAVAINSSRIVFNMNSQGFSSLNYRTFQTVACKRLLISDNRGELSLFEGEMPYWSDKEDLQNKIRYYLSNEQAYNSVVENCWKIGRKNHNSKENVDFILKTVFG